MTTVLEVAAAVLMVAGAACVLTVAVAYFRERDAVSRVNALGLATALGLPMIAVAGLIGWSVHTGFQWTLLAKTLAAVAAFIMVSSVASNTLARASYMSGAPLDPETSPNDLLGPGSSTVRDDSEPGE